MISIPYYETSYFVFSNFSAHSIELEGALYPTVEHAYHAAKFDDERLKEQIRNAGSPLEAFQLGKTYKDRRRADWDEKKVEVLTGLVREKVSQHTEVKEALLATGNDEIVENNPHDSFWGSGSNRKCENHMSKILMMVRTEITLHP